MITGHINDIYQGDGFGKKFSTLEIGSVVTVAGAGDRPGTTVSMRSITTARTASCRSSD
ncbi:hypothetical protein ACETU7_05105 [Rhodococcus sp. 3Y1]